jgi:CHAT domain
MQLSSSFEGENFSRPIQEDKIQYFLIGERPESIGYDIPQILASPSLNLISSMPKSIVQILDPFGWHLSNMRTHASFHINLGVLFDDYSPERYDSFFEIPYKVLVIFLNTKEEKIFIQLEKLRRFFLVTSDYQDISNKLKLSKFLQKKTFSSPGELSKKILDFAVNELDITSKILKKTKRNRANLIQEFCQNSNFKKEYNFLPSQVNTNNIYQILSLDKPGFLEFQAVDHNKRTESILKSSSALESISQCLRIYSQNQEKSLNVLRPPIFILAYPFHNPDYKKILNEASYKDKNLSVKKAIQYLNFIEQNIDNYCYTVELNSKDRQELLAHSILTKHRYALYLDLIGYLHSTFDLSPYIRAPMRGKSLNKYLVRLSPSQYKKTNDVKSISSNIADIGKALHDNLPNEIVSFLDQFVDGIFTISDLPIEWLLIDNTPLAFLCDVCRVPETISTNLFSQFKINCSQSFNVPKDILEKTLVVCGAKSEDPIFKNYQMHIDSKENGTTTYYKTAHIQSKKDFFDLVNKVHPYLLIIDSHGDFKTQSEGSYIWIGDEKLTGEDIIKHLPQIPLVILSCCLATPIYGNSNTIAQAFFEKGSFSVLSTFCPISINTGFVLYFRILNNLESASKNGIHESWMNFISHNIRTSYFDDFLCAVLDKFGRQILDKEKYTITRTRWQIKCMDRYSRHSAYKEIKEIILRCIQDENKSSVETFLTNISLIPEFMIYTHLGRGDLIKFDSWINKS